MANLNESDNWPEGIYQIEEDDPVLGGPAGITNLPPGQLAARARYQRLRNVTPWDETLSYPAGLAFVSHEDTTWRSVEASTGVEPGTNPAKWARWGHSAQELAALFEGFGAAHAAATDPHSLYAWRSTFPTVPAVNQGAVITVSTPHLRQMVWDGTKYVRAPWHQPGMVMYSIDNPAGIPGFLPVRADVVYAQANYPDLSSRMGLSGSGTFALVELRGEFIRCLDNGRGVDAARPHASFQKGTLVAGYDDDATSAADITVLRNKSTVDYGTDAFAGLYPGASPAFVTGQALNSTIVSGAMLSVTRPRNVALPAWVSY